ncbi:hypothetical protein CY35_13G114600 [Sphagnum magellanicum]|nr:hypothetical protein CY35_13G114600 [Sphagnum magellanicum]KAH9544350.1 hypothetical protein CY35_13G114600 [Sphagnum magellanicum]
MAATAAAAGRRTSSDEIAGADDGGGDSALPEPMLLFPFMLHVGVVLIITWLTSVFSINSLFFLVMSFIYLHWVEKQGREREQRWIRHEERRKAHVAGLGDGETVRWLNRAITSMWPVCLESFSSQQFLMPIAPWFFNSYKPWGVSKVLLQKLHLGNRAPIFTLMRALDQTSDGDHLVVEAAMEFASGDDMSAEMLVALHQWFGGFRTTFYISKLHIEGKVKIAVKFVDGWPVIGRIRFCFAHPPYIQMTASPLYKGGIDVTYFPGADRWLEATLAAALEQSLLEPNMLVVNLEMLANSAAFLNPRAEQAVASTHDNKSPPIAMVHVKVLDAKNLRIADMNGFSDPYVKVSLGLQGSKKTAVKSKNLNPIWNEEFQFPISSWDLPNILVLHVLDKDLLFFHDSLGSCMVHVSNYRDGEWHEENLDLEQHKQKKKEGQLHFAIMVEEIITQTFDHNPSVGGVSSQPGTRELYMNGNAESTQSSPASTSMFMRNLNTDLPPANNNTPPGDQKRKGKTSHSRSSSASGLETQTTMMPPESQAREGEVIDIIDVPIGPRGTFTILHPGKLSPRNWPSQNRGHTRRGKGRSKEKVEYEGSEGWRPIKRYHNRRRSAGASQESLPAVEKESEQSVSSMEHSRELELLCAPERNGTVMFILEPNTTPIQSLASDELPPEMSIHPPTLTPILSNQERADLEDEDDEKTQTVELTPNGTHFTRPHHDEDDAIMNSQNETKPPKSKKGGWWEKTAQRMKHKQKTHLDTTTTTKKDQVVNSPELIEYSDEFDNGEAANYSSMQLLEEDEPLIHEDEKKIINSTQSRRGSSLRNISEKTLAKLGLGPKKP